MKAWYLLIDFAIISVVAVCHSTVIKTSFERKPFSRRTSNFRVFWECQEIASFGIWGIPEVFTDIWDHFKPFETISNHFKPLQKPFQTNLNRFWGLRQPSMKIRVRSKVWVTSDWQRKLRLTAVGCGGSCLVLSGWLPALVQATCLPGMSLLHQISPACFIMRLPSRATCLPGMSLLHQISPTCFMMRLPSRATCLPGMSRLIFRYSWYCEFRIDASFPTNPRSAAGIRHDLPDECH